VLFIFCSLIVNVVNMQFNPLQSRCILLKGKTVRNGAEFLGHLVSFCMPFTCIIIGYNCYIIQ
jgi:hypothetical protein